MSFMPFLDLFFTAFHTLLILFNLLGWIWEKTRRLNLICILLTMGSWLILGLFFGLGYCPLTQWHFTILRNLGHTNLPPSYISFLITTLTGLHPDPGLVEAGTAGGLILALGASLYVNFKNRFSRKLKKT